MVRKCRALVRCWKPCDLGIVLWFDRQFCVLRVQWGKLLPVVNKLDQDCVRTYLLYLTVR